MIRVTLHLACGGCDATTEATGRYVQRIEQVSPLWARVYSPRVELDAEPDGWMMFDPYTRCCYCPECWASIENVATAEEASH